MKVEIAYREIDNSDEINRQITYGEAVFCKNITGYPSSLNNTFDIIEVVIDGVRYVPEAKEAQDEPDI